MKTLYIECAMGAAGDMLTAALLELLPDKDAFIEKLNALNLPGVVFAAEPSVKCGITGTHMRVTVHGEEETSEDVHDHEHHHGHEHEHEHDHEHHHDHEHEHDHDHEHDHEHEHYHEYHHDHDHEHDPSNIDVDDYGWVAIASGYDYIMAIQKDGTLCGWGMNDFGQVGSGTYKDPCVMASFASSFFFCYF